MIKTNSRTWHKRKVIIHGVPTACLVWNTRAGHRMYSFDSGATWDESAYIAHTKASTPIPYKRIPIPLTTN